MSINRRHFLKAGGISILPAITPLGSVLAAPEKQPAPSNQLIKFYGDGEMFQPTDYLNELQKINAANPILPDRYGTGGAVKMLEEKFVTITKKEAAVFMPTGTMANQLAVSVLSGESSKVYVQDTSHYFRDEADAAQTVFGKRLMPLAKGEAYFTAAQLQEAIESVSKEEVFKTGIGAVAIEIPVRRNQGRMMPIEEIKKVSNYCRSNKIPLHLDGARLYMAAAWSGVSISEYSSYFDTVYISLYKYLGASAGAILCGDKSVIDKMPHLIKIHGGSMYGNWTNAAMAVAGLNGFEDRLARAKKRGEEVFQLLNQQNGIKVSPFPDGTNIYSLQLAKQIDGKRLHEKLRKEFNIIMPAPNDQNQSQLSVNETILYKDAGYVAGAFKAGSGV